MQPQIGDTVNSYYGPGVICTKPVECGSRWFCEIELERLPFPKAKLPKEFVVHQATKRVIGGTMKVGSPRILWMQGVECDGNGGWRVPRPLTVEQHRAAATALSGPGE